MTVEPRAMIVPTLSQSPAPARQTSTPAKAGATAFSDTTSERRTSGTTTSAPARAGADDLVSFPPQFPLDKRSGALGKLGNVLAPRFADKHFERRYNQQRGQGLDTVMLVFW